jgi:hypothetical protein
MTFQPGESGNPAGRPRGSRNKKTLLLEALLRKVLGMGKMGGDARLRQLIERTLVSRPRKPIAARRPRRRGAVQQKRGGACKYQRKYKRDGQRRRGTARGEKRGAC